MGPTSSDTGRCGYLPDLMMLGNTISHIESKTGGQHYDGGNEKPTVA
jgi:hypothetical protein